MRAWVVGAAVIEGPEGLLLVRNRRRGGHHDWTTPGGVIEVDDGEALIDGLAREVREETGITVTEWEGPIYRIAAEAPGMGWTLAVECYRAVAFEGELVIDDPDGIVVDACYVAPDACGRHLESAHPWVSEPLMAWLGAPWSGSRWFDYHIAGEDVTDIVVTRL